VSVGMIGVFLALCLAVARWMITTGWRLKT
jgi:hypothetical protein